MIASSFKKKVCYLRYRGTAGTGWVVSYHPFELSHLHVLELDLGCSLTFGCRGRSNTAIAGGAPLRSPRCTVSTDAITTITTNAVALSHTTTRTATSTI